MEKIIPYKKTIQKGKAKGGHKPPADLGRNQPRHQKAGQQQSL